MQSIQAELIQQNKNQYQISGPVDFSTVPHLMRQTTNLFPNKMSTAQNIMIDMSQITICNSAGLALMLEIVNVALARNVSVQFENLPDTLLTIAKAYGVENEISDMCNKNVQ